MRGHTSMTVHVIGNVARDTIDPSPIRSDYRDIWPLVDVAIANRSEAIELGGAMVPEEAAAALLRKGIGLVVLTRGADGAMILARDRRLAQPAEPVVAIDTAGAAPRSAVCCSPRHQRSSHHDRARRRARSRQCH